MAHLFRALAERKGDEAALIDDRGETTWAAYNARVNRLIGALRNAGLEAGDTISIFAGNSSEYFEVMGACAHGGWIYVPVNWHFTADELAYVVDNSDSIAIVADQQFIDVALRGTKEVELKTKIAIGGAAGDFQDYETFMHAAEPTEPENESFGGPMFYTSGTTGRPKGVRSSTFQSNAPIETMEFVGAALGDMLKLPADGVSLLCGPVYHSAQWAWSFLPMLRGSRVVMRQRFDPQETLRLIDAYRVTNSHMVPTQFHRFLRLDAAERESFDGSSLVAIWHGAAPCPPQVKKQMIEWWGPHIYEYYGSTEGSIVTTVDSQEWLTRPGTVGKPMPTSEVMILGEDATPCATGEEGQIYVKSLMGADFEYYKEPDKTAEAHLEPGVYTFGDIGYLDEDGYLYMSDRKIDMIISGGVNIYPAEIEAVLIGHPAVHDAAVFGIPNEEFGEEVKAAVEVTPGLEASEKLAEDLVAHCREHLAGFKVPRSVDFVDELPRHPTGKLLKRLLRDKYWQEAGRKI
ncbi:MAG: AMP-binding protein [Pseudomonadales bacterium]